MSEVPSLLAPTTKRLRILSDFEITALYSRPQLTKQERVWIFELNQKEEKILTTEISTLRKIDAIIQLGYFKKMRKFFNFKWHEMVYKAT